MTRTKTKTIVAVALTIFSIGSMLAGLYYYYGSRGHRPAGTSTNTGSSASSSSSSGSTSTPASTAGQLSLSRSSYNFGEVTVGENETTTITASNTGNADLTLNTINVSGTGFSQSGGTCSNNQTLASNSSCTVTVQFTPAEDKNYSGTLAISSSDATQTVSLTGEGGEENGGGGTEDGTTGGGGDTPGSSSDLVVTSVTGLFTAFEAGTTLTLTVTITNQGIASTASANACPNGQFAVKGYTSLSTSVEPIFTWNVSDLEAGQSVSNANSFRVAPACGIHTWCAFPVKVDTDSCIGESNETNNAYYGVASYRAR